ncbi:alpha/beta fold hydrolase [Hydrogenophaga sp.]|jgi:non-heme chloroperoxidase|uniref:alpha/beta fold hydrolase n=1 Tax=Hydrogenophaga sp. TaxID=1904254 RepID=UPI003F6ECD98
MQRNTIAGGGKLSISVIDSGRSAGPTLLFVHGFSQAALSWKHQLDSELTKNQRLVAIDLRGHGQSEKPLDAAHYTDSDLWADDIAAVIESTGSKKVILVGWSYGGLVVCDYLRRHGQDRVAGVVFASAVTKVGKPDAMALLGPKLLQHIPAVFSDEASALVPTLGQFIRDCEEAPLSDGDFYEALGYNCATPSAVRVGLFSRELDNDDVLAMIDVPTLIVHGEEDKILLPESSRHIQRLVKGSQLHVEPDVAHAVFREAPERFNRRLADFATQVRGGAA